MIKAGIFDIGGVLIDWSNEWLFQDVDQTLHLSSNLRAKHWHSPMKLLEVGEITEAEFWQKFLEDTKALGELPKESLFLRRFEQEFHINQQVVRIARELKTKGFQVAVLSNTIAPHSKFMRSTHLFDLFKPIVLSNEVGFAKPNSEIYELVLKKLKLNPDEVFFVDDRPENVEGANRSGIHGILYKDPQHLREALKKLGVSL